MYLTHMEHSLIKNACMDRNFYAISEIVIAHKDFKEDELARKEERKIISPLRHIMLSKKVDKQALVCIDAIKDIRRSNRYYIKEAIGNFEKSVYELDMIGRDINENPISAMIRSNKNKRRR